MAFITLQADLPLSVRYIGAHRLLHFF